MAPPSWGFKRSSEQEPWTSCLNTCLCQQGVEFGKRVSREVNGRSCDTLALWPGPCKGFIQCRLQGQRAGNSCVQQGICKLHIVTAHSCLINLISFLLSHKTYLPWVEFYLINTQVLSALHIHLMPSRIWSVKPRYSNRLSNFHNWQIPSGSHISTSFSKRVTSADTSLSAFYISINHAPPLNVYIYTYKHVMLPKCTYIHIVHNAYMHPSIHPSLHPTTYPLQKWYIMHPSIPSSDRLPTHPSLSVVHNTFIHLSIHSFLESSSHHLPIPVRVT